MDGEIELISDGEGLVLSGDPSDIERPPIIRLE